MQKLDGLIAASRMVQPEFAPAGSTKPMRNISQSAKAVWAGAVAINTDQQAIKIEAEKQLFQGPMHGHRHRAAFVLTGITACTGPLKERCPAVDLHVQGKRAAWCSERVGARRLIGRDRSAGGSSPNNKYMFCKCLRNR